VSDWLPIPASTYAGSIDNLIWVITAIVGVWFLLAEGILFWFIFRYRRRAGQPAGYVRGDRKSQTAWILIPCVAILGFDLYIDASSARVWEEMKQSQPPHELLIRIEGRQWSWTMTHPGPDGRLDTPDDIVAPNEVHVPQGSVVRFELRSADTLHSLWVPELRLKQDAVPGRTFTGWFEATRPGSYGVLCAELCGAAHGMMRGTMIVHGPEEYRAWLDEATAPVAATPAATTPAATAPAATAPAASAPAASAFQPTGGSTGS